MVAVHQQEHEEDVQTLLLVEDNPGDAALVRSYLKGDQTRWIIDHVDRLDLALELLSERVYPLVVADLGLPDADGLEAVEAIRRIAPNTPLVVMSGQDDRMVAVEALGRGAQDFLVKDEADRNALKRAITYAVARKRNELWLSDRAMKDALTGLANRAAFESRLAQDMARSRRTSDRVALINIDLDLFKPINDQHGHAAGDHVLCVVARRLEDVVREYDLVARLGGDEFVVLISGPFDERLPSTLADRVIRSLAEPIPLESGVEVRVSASCGVALFPDASESTTDLCQAADRAMYEAKRSGRNRVVEFSTDMRPKTPSIPSLDSAVNEVVDRGHLVSYFQPQIVLATGAVRGFEALIRWPPSDRLANVDVGQFIRTLERTGMIVPAGEQMLDSACGALAAWRTVRPDITVAVNVSSRELESKRFPDAVEKALAKASVPPSSLEIEVPAAVLDLEAPTIAASLTSLSEIGVRIVVDHFGSDISSVAGLARHSVSTIKLDRRFTAAREPQQVMVLGAMHAMAEHLGLDVVAFGIETPDEAERAACQGCRIAQGFLFAGAVPQSAATTMLEAAPWRPAA